MTTGGVRRSSPGTIEAKRLAKGLVKGGRGRHSSHFPGVASTSSGSGTADAPAGGTGPALAAEGSEGTHAEAGPGSGLLPKAGPGGWPLWSWYPTSVDKMCAGSFVNTAPEGHQGPLPVSWRWRLQ